MNLPEYQIRPIRTCIPLERLSVRDFETAQSAVLRNAVTGKAPAQHAEARLLWDRESLYACFLCEAGRPLATLRRHDAPLWKESVVELFIDPLGLGKVYYELEINPLNASFDALIINDFQKGKGRGPRFQGFTGWDPESLKHRSLKSGGMWIVFLKIDFADLFLTPGLPVKKGDIWRGNFFRIDCEKGRTEYCAWSPMGKLDFHCSDRFGVWKVA
jgi:hypothetical protein